MRVFFKARPDLKEFPEKGRFIRKNGGTIYEILGGSDVKISFAKDALNELEK